jgi:MFS family permease
LRAPSPRSQLGTLFLTVFIDLVGFSIIFPLFPAMLSYYLGSGPEGTGGALERIVAALRSASAGESAEAQFYAEVLFGGILGSLYSLLQFIFAPLWGRLSDRAGRKPVLLLTIGGLALSYLLWFFSGSFLLLVASRFFGGMMSGNISVATAAVADSTGPEGRARGMGVIGAAFGLGFILGPALGGAFFLLERQLGFSAALSFVPGINPFSLAAGGAFLLSAWNFLRVWRKFAETLPPEARGRAEAERPLNPLRLARGFDLPGVNRANLVYFIFLLAFAGMEFTLTFLARDRFDYTPERIGMVLFTYVGLIIALVQGGVVRRLAPLLGEKRVAIAGLLLVVPGLIATGLAASQAVLFVGLTFLAAGSALAMPSLTALVSLYTPSSRQGEVLGVFRSLGALSRAVGPLLACAVYWKLGSEWPYLGGAALLLLPILLALRLPPVRGAYGKPRGDDAGRGD